MITISIVTYKQSLTELIPTLESVSKISLDYKLFIIDNSPTDELKTLSNREKTTYYFNNGNIGFGSGHNIAIKMAYEVGSKFHLILNPDITFNENVIENIVEYMESNQDVGLLMPKILYPNGKIQFLPKLLPNPFLMLARILTFPNNIKSKLINKYELRFINNDKIIEVPNITGCFSFFKTEILKKIDAFDENFFMYFEDVDISRRANKVSKTIYYQKEIVYHCYGRGAHKSFALLKMFLASFVVYYNKWGWIFDKERKEVNKQTLKKLI